jgi:hypothetical protein
VQGMTAKVKRMTVEALKPERSEMQQTSPSVLTALVVPESELEQLSVLVLRSMDPESHPSLHTFCAHTCPLSTAQSMPLVVPLAMYVPNMHCVTVKLLCSCIAPPLHILYLLNKFIKTSGVHVSKSADLTFEM